jgi:hypothetical protein
MTACAPLPTVATQRALYVDARKALRGESRLGWTVDRVEIEDAVAQTEPSACQVTPHDRAALRDWVAARLGAEGGPAAAQYRAGARLGDLKEPIELERTGALLAEVERHLPGDCPFWLSPDADYRGLHSVAHRFVVLAESMGGGSLSITSGRTRAGAGGAARLFASQGVSSHVQLALGIEVGGDAVLQKSAQGELEPKGAFRFGVPLLARWIDIDRIYDVEVAAVTALTDGVLTPWGARIALAGGVSGLRRIGFMPSLQIYAGYELYPAQRDLPLQHVLRLGTRVGVDWDP